MGLRAPENPHPLLETPTDSRGFTGRGRGRDTISRTGVQVGVRGPLSSGAPTNPCSDAKPGRASGFEPEGLADRKPHRSRFVIASSGSRTSGRTECEVGCGHDGAHIARKSQVDLRRQRTNRRTARGSQPRARSPRARRERWATAVPPSPRTASPSQAPCSAGTLVAMPVPETPFEAVAAGPVPSS